MKKWPVGGLVPTPNRGPALTGRRNMSQVVADELLRRIDAGEYPVGGRAPTERELMELFAVGRSTAREAVRVLVSAEILDVRPGRGPVVLRTSDASQNVLDPLGQSVLLEDQSLVHLYEFRLLVETEAAANAAFRASPAEVAELNSQLREFRVAVTQGRPTYELDVQFHLSLARASHNEVYVTVLEAVTERLAQSRAITDSVSGARELAVLGHSEICAAVQRHDADASRKAMQRHILAGLAALEEAHGIDLSWPGRPS
jgi:GntR family transcriptional regulator, transcriptional repressor for pyruvate dehydrogenase complex